MLNNMRKIKIRQKTDDDDKKLYKKYWKKITASL